MGQLVAGTPAPMFEAESRVNSRFATSSLGGRYVLLVFPPACGKAREATYARLDARAGLFADDRLVAFVVAPSRDVYDSRADKGSIRVFLDEGGEIASAYGADAERWVVLDPTLRVLTFGGAGEVERILSLLASLPPPQMHAGVESWAPVLMVPRIFEPEMCRRLIDIYDAHGGSPSGTMQQVGDRTVGVLSDFKRRRDASIVDEGVKTDMRVRLKRRLLPEIERAFQFRATRIERYIVACYDAGDGGYFRPHRDNTTAGTAHRKFAVSINLNGDFEGGDLRFPEYGLRTYRPPVGGAVVFSCSLLHEATPVTRGTRYATLPFLYDEAGAAVREANLHSLKATAESAAPVA